MMEKKFRLNICEHENFLKELCMIYDPNGVERSVTCQFNVNKTCKHVLLVTQGITLFTFTDK